MIRYIRTTYVHLSMSLISVMLTSCGGALVPITPSAIVTEVPSPSPTVASEDATSKIDKILTVHTEGETFTGAVLVARNNEILLSQGYGWADSQFSTNEVSSWLDHQAIYSDGDLDLTDSGPA